MNVSHKVKGRSATPLWQVYPRTLYQGSLVCLLFPVICFAVLLGRRAKHLVMSGRQTNKPWEKRWWKNDDRNWLTLSVQKGLMLCIIRPWLAEWPGRLYTGARRRILKALTYLAHAVIAHDGQRAEEALCEPFFCLGMSILWTGSDHGRIHPFSIVKIHRMTC